jgi:hypothetical protein
MKKYSLFLFVVFFISIASLQQSAAQDKTKVDKDKEMKQSIEQQKKAIADQQKAMAEAEQTLNEKQTEIEYYKNDSLAPESKDRTKIYMNLSRDRGRSFNFDDPFVFAGQDMNGWFDHSIGDSERSTWDFSKTVKENTFSRDYIFGVEKTAKTVVMSVVGDCKSGEIRIKIIMPNGKNYSDILIDESGNLNWRKSFTISETGNQDKAGDWKFQISSTKATGFFKISLQTY